MRELRTVAALVALAMGAPPAAASPSRIASPDALYLRARAAEVLGDARTASEGFATLLERDPTDRLVAQGAYTQALAVGDLALALKAAHALDRIGALRPEGRLLFAVDAIRTHDWKTASATIEQVQQEKLFGFLTPFLRAWVAQGSRYGDPLPLVDAVRGLALGEPYLMEQRALLQIASGQVEAGVETLRGAPGGSLARQPLRLRMIAADALARTHQQARALALLDGDDPSLVAARQRIAAGKRLPAPLDDAAEGVATLLVRVASDFGQKQLIPVAFDLARFATFLAPQDGSAWLVLGDTFATMRQPDDALVALGHIAGDDPLAPAAAALRIALLSQTDQNEAAVGEALKLARAPGAGAAAWSRVGDVYLAMEKPAEAAQAYAKAIAAADSGQAAVDVRSTLYLQQGSALDLAGDWPGAKAALLKAQALAPNEPLILNQLGFSEIAHRDDVEHASGLIAQASRLRPDDAAITDSLGWSHFLAGRPAEAVPLLEKAAAADPGEPAINEHLGDAYWSVGRRLEARYAWRAALVTAEDKDRARIAAKIEAGWSAATAAP